MGSVFVGVIVSTIQIPGWIGAIIPTAWIALFIIVPCLLFRYKIEITLAHILGSLFLLYAGLSLIWTSNFNIAFFEYCKLLVLAGVFCISFNLKRVYQGLAIGLGVSAVIGLAQWLWDWDGVFKLYPNAPVGLFINPDLFCEFSAVMFLALLVSRLWLWLPVSLPGLLLVHSRAAILGLTVGLGMWGWRKSKILVLLIGVICIGVFYFKVNAFNSSYDRLVIWIDTFQGLTLFGHGVGSFDLLYPLYSTIDTSIARPMNAHNDLLQLIFDLGIGVIPLLVMIGLLLNARDHTEIHGSKIVFVAIATISFFSFPLHVPYLAFIWLLVAGNLARNSVSNGFFSWYFGSSILVGTERQRYSTI